MLGTKKLQIVAWMVLLLGLCPTFAQKPSVSAERQALDVIAADILRVGNVPGGIEPQPSMLTVVWLATKRAGPPIYSFCSSNGGW